MEIQQAAGGHSMKIHNTAVIDEDAVLAADVTVGPGAVIGPGVSIGKGTRVGSHAVVVCNARIGSGCSIHSHCVIGGDPQDLGYDGKPSYVEIGDRTTIREFVTISRGSHGRMLTSIGNDCMLMAGVHVAHDCSVGNNVIMSNLATLAGHITVEDRVIIGGLAAFHQFVRIGRMAMIGGTAGVMQDVPPFCMIQGAPPASIRGLNLVGLARNGVDSRSQRALKNAFRLLFNRGMSKEHAIEEIQQSVELTPEVRHMIEFVSNPSRRGICRSEISRQAKLSVVDTAPAADQAGELKLPPGELPTDLNGTDQ
jgi:UDP-N-acetylglucosamine acyltransferase